jgi:hypothetical protein
MYCADAYNQTATDILDGSEERVTTRDAHMSAPTCRPEPHLCFVVATRSKIDTNHAKWVATAAMMALARASRLAFRPSGCDPHMTLLRGVARLCQTRRTPSVRWRKNVGMDRSPVFCFMARVERGPAEAGPRRHVRKSPSTGTAQCARVLVILTRRISSCRQNRSSLES